LTQEAKLKFNTNLFATLYDMIQEGGQTYVITFPASTGGTL